MKITKMAGNAALKGLVVGMATTNATLGTLTNPFLRDERRKSPTERWHSTMQDFDIDLSQEVRDCDECYHLPNAKPSVLNKMFRAGQEMPLNEFFGYGSPSKEKRIAERDSHCPKHWKRVARYQKHYRNS